MYAPDRRNDVRIFSNAFQLSERRLAFARFDILALEKERNEEEAYRHAACYFNESESWVRAFSAAIWQDRSANLVSGQMHAFVLYVDAGGFDPMPSC